MSGVARVAGVVPCNGGWVAVSMSVRSGVFRIFLCASFVEVCAFSWKALAVEAPIGLPDVMMRGGRTAERAARALLGRQAQVADAPSRSVLRARSFAEACRLCRRSSSGAPVGLTRQSFGLFPRIREVDRYISPPLQDSICETHSELAFLEMRRLSLQSDTGVAEEQPSSVYRTSPERLRHVRHRPEGASERCALLRQHDFPAELLERMHFPPELAREADCLAACAACWTARRIFYRQERALPVQPPKDRFGLRMEKRY